MSLTLFIIAIEYNIIPRGIRWGTFTTLEDLDFANDIALFSHSHQHIQDKPNRLHKYSGSIGLKISTQKNRDHGPKGKEPISVKVKNHIL